MTSRIRYITFDCHDPYRMAGFWGDLLGFVPDPDDPNQPGESEAAVIDPDRRLPGLLFIRVPEAKTVKNRVHFDLLPNQPRDETVNWALAHGAEIVSDRREPDGTGWVVMADPEGNEFCVERSAAERVTGDVPPGSKRTAARA